MGHPLVRGQEKSRSRFAHAVPMQPDAPLKVTALVVTPGVAFCNERLIQLTIKLLDHIFLG